MSICDAGTGGGGGGGMLLPAIAGNALPAVLYFLLLAWCLLGMYTLTNRLMQAIVVITSASKWVDCTEDDGEGDEDSSGGLVQREVMRWNPTVAGITLMALGSSAPEILIASVELIGGGFFSGDRDSGDSIGASTIVGSAAFNFFVISAVVVTALPDGDTRVISGREVFFVTTICGLLAYVWLLAVLVVSSPDVVTVWEAGVTVALFPAFVLVCYLTDKGYVSRLLYVVLKPEQLMGLGDGNTLNHSGTPLQRARRRWQVPAGPDGTTKLGWVTYLPNDVAALLRGNLKQLTVADAADAMRWYGNSRSRAQFIVKASHFLAGHLHPRLKEVPPSLRGASVNIAEGRRRLQVSQGLLQESQSKEVGFAASRLSCAESCGTITIEVERRGDVSSFLRVQYATLDGSATGGLMAGNGVDYRTSSGTLVFEPFNAYQSLEITIFDDDQVEDDETFSVVLSNAEDAMDKDFSILVQAQTEIAEARKAVTVLILDDDGPPELEFAQVERTVLGGGSTDTSGEMLLTAPVYIVSESAGTAKLRVQRRGRSTSAVSCKFQTFRGSATPGVATDGCLLRNPLNVADYEDTFEARAAHHTDGTAAHFDERGAGGMLTFQIGESEKQLPISIFDTEALSKDKAFYVQLLDPSGCRLGNVTVAKVRVVEDPHILEICNDIVRYLAHESWAEEAKATRGTVETEDPLRSNLVRRKPVDHHAEYSKKYGCGPHMVAIVGAVGLPWLMLERFLTPPAHIGGGWPCFFVTLAYIAGVTVFLVDAAELFGCYIGVRVSSTAITAIAVGTSLPDLLAARQSVRDASTADLALSMICTSNLINVLVGLGVPWLIGALYWAQVGTTEAWIERLGGNYRHLVDTHPEGALIVASGDLSFDIGMYLLLAVVATVLLAERRRRLGYEIGGDLARETAVFMVFLWVFWLFLVSMRAYGGFDPTYLYRGTANVLDGSVSSTGWSGPSASGSGTGWGQLGDVVHCANISFWQRNKEPNCVREDDMSHQLHVLMSMILVLGFLGAVAFAIFHKRLEARRELKRAKIAALDERLVYNTVSFEGVRHGHLPSMAPSYSETRWALKIGLALQGRPCWTRGNIATANPLLQQNMAEIIKWDSDTVGMFACTLHIGGIGDMDSRALRRIFEPYGHFVTSIIRRRVDKLGRDTSWAIVTMGDQRAAERALQARAFGRKLVIRPFDVTLASSGDGLLAHSLATWNKGKLMFEEQALMLQRYGRAQIESVDVMRE